MKIEGIWEHARRTGHRVTMTLNELDRCEDCDWRSPAYFLVEPKVAARHAAPGIDDGSVGGLS